MVNWITPEELDARVRMRMAEHGFVEDPLDPRFAQGYRDALLEVDAEIMDGRIWTVERHLHVRHGGIPQPPQTWWRRLLRQPVPLAVRDLWWRALPEVHHWMHCCARERDHLPDDLSLDVPPLGTRSYVILRPILRNGVWYAPLRTVRSTDWRELSDGQPLTRIVLAESDPGTKELIRRGYIA